MKIATLISNVKPSRTFAFGMSEAIAKCVNAIQSESNSTIESVDPEEGEIRCIWNLKINRLLGGKGTGILIRYSFSEPQTGMTIVTATCSRENGAQDFFDIGGVYEKIMCKTFDKMV